jgi:hypothetical protein
MKHEQVTVGNATAKHVTVFHCCFELTAMCTDTGHHKFAAEAWLEVSRIMGALIADIFTAGVVTPHGRRWFKYDRDKL